MPVERRVIYGAGGYKIFDADTHLYEPVEQIEAYRSAADRAKLDALAPLVTRT
jgi:hypothetical protein